RDPRRQLVRHALPAALEVHAIALAGGKIAKLRRADDGCSFVALQRKQAIPHFNVSSGRTCGVDARYDPAIAGDVHRPAGILHVAVMARDRVDRERQEREIGAAEQNDEPDKRRAALIGHDGYLLSDERRIRELPLETQALTASLPPAATARSAAKNSATGFPARAES